MIGFLRLICVVVIFTLTGCAPAITQRYGVSSKNMMLLRDIASNSQSKISVGKFEGDSTSVGCRGASMSPPENMTFASYLRNALIEELMVANLYSEKSTIELTGSLKEFEVECSVGTGKWKIDMDLAINGKQKFNVKNDYLFEGAYIGVTVFNNAQQSLMPATQDFIHQLLSNPEFKSTLFKQPST